MSRFLFTRSLSTLASLSIGIQRFSSHCNDTNSEKKETDHHKQNIKNCIQAISLVLKDKEQVDISIEERELRGKPWSSYHKIKNNPDVVVFPNSTEDVAEVLKICTKYKVPIIPFGGGTSIEGHTLATQGLSIYNL